MSEETIPIPGARDVRASLDEHGGRGVVAACPPHPQHRGHRGDERLRAVSDALGERGTDCLRFDYGAWDEGRGERADADNAVAWAGERYDRVGLFGFSFGGAVALLAAAERNEPTTVSALAPTAELAGGDLDAVAALESLSIPVQVVYGSRDDTAAWRPVVGEARKLGYDVVEIDADHFFVGQAPKVGERVADFLAPHLRDTEERE